MENLFRGFIMLKLKKNEGDIKDPKIYAYRAAPGGFKYFKGVFETT